MGLCGSSSVGSGPKNPLKVDMDHFVKGRQVGEGGFGKVFAMKHYKTGKWFALKDLSKKTLRGSKSIPMVFNERNLLVELPTSVWMINAYHAFQDVESCFILMDLALGGDLRYHMKLNKGKLAEDRARFYSLCTVLALDFLHANGVVHRDIKPENIVVASTGYCCLTDLGISKKVDADGVVTGKSGTRSYMAPECFSDDSKHSYSADCWSLGVLVHELLTGNNTRLSPTNYAAGLSPGAAEFCKRCLQPEPAMRATSADLVDDPWFATGGYDLAKFKKQEVAAPWKPESNQTYFDVAVTDMDNALGGGFGDEPTSKKKLVMTESDEFEGYDYNLDVAPESEA